MRLSNRLSRPILAGAMLLSLTACSSPFWVKRQPVNFLEILPPIELTQDCPVPSSTHVRTNGEFVEWSKAVYDSLLACNVDKAALRQWYDSVQKVYKENR